MSRIAYLDFDLQIQREGAGYCAQVLNSPGGQGRRPFTVPFSDLELDNFFLRFGRSTRAVRRVDSPELEAAKLFGERLFAVVFEGEVRDCLRSSLDEADRQPTETGLRIRLRFKDVPELTNLPWEYFYNPAFNRFLCLSVETPLVRYLDLPERIRPPVVTSPLRVLVMICSPSDYPALDADAEWTKLRESVRDLEACGAIALERLDKGTMLGLQRQLRKEEYHVFHFVGHGGFDDRLQDGVLVLEDERGRGRPVSGQEFGTILHDERTLRLAVLNACEGARSSRVDPFAGVAQSLVQQGIPAVIAMQFEITDEAAIIFSHEFYAGIADGYPVDAALAESRKAIYAGGNALEWGAPVLYLRAPDGRVFDLQVTKTRPPQPKIQVQIVSVGPPPVGNVRPPPNIAEYVGGRQAQQPSPKGVFSSKVFWFSFGGTLLLLLLFIGSLVILSEEDAGKDSDPLAQEDTPTNAPAPKKKTTTVADNKTATDNSFMGRGDALWKEGKKEEAIELYTKARDYDSKFVLPHRRLGGCYFELGRYEEASAQYNEAVKLDAKDALSYSGLGAVYNKQKRYGESVAAYRQAIELEPTNTTPRFDLANAFLTQANYEDAIKMWQSVIDLEPDESAAYYNIGLSYFLQGRYEEGIPKFNRSIELNPKSANANYNLARSYYHLGRDKDVEAPARRAIELDPKDASQYLILGHALRRVGRYDDSIAVLRKAIELEPDSGDQHDSLALTYSRQNSLENAASQADEALRLDPNNYWYAADKALVLALQGRPDEARKIWKKLAAMDHGSDPQSRMNLATMKACLAEISTDDLEEVQRILSGKKLRRSSLNGTLEFLEIASRSSATSPGLERMIELFKTAFKTTDATAAR
jgi:tetratricopeptide (TPR) repeat protein